MLPRLIYFYKIAYFVYINPALNTKGNPRLYQEIYLDSEHM